MIFPSQDLITMNDIYPEQYSASPCPSFDQEEVFSRYGAILEDESRLRAESIKRLYSPRSVGEVVSAVQELAARGQSCAFAGGQTGIAGGAVPIEADTVVSLAAMNRLLAIGRRDGEAYVRLEPGLSLSHLYEVLQRSAFEDLVLEEGGTSLLRELAASSQKLWFPVNPTEATAHVGGIVATNASGARTYRYGAVRDWVRGLKVVLADGRLLSLRRGEVMADGNTFILHNVDGSQSNLTFEPLSWPDTKATIGYPLAIGMDLLDLFIGSEGTLGAVVEIELALALRPEASMGVMAVLADEEQACDLVVCSREAEGIVFDAIEYFDREALRLLREKKEAAGLASPLPRLPRWDGFAVYFEFSGTEAALEGYCPLLQSLIESVGGNIDHTWAATFQDELRSQRLFRHTVPEEVNALIGQRKLRCPGLHKVGTDMAVPDEKLHEVMRMYRHGLAELGIEAVIFGHIGDNHVHVNMLPQDMDELRRAKALYGSWAEAVVQMGGVVAAEHGIGRIKKSMLAIQCSPAELAMMKEVRGFFDPQGIFSPGVLF